MQIRNPKTRSISFAGLALSAVMFTAGCGVPSLHILPSSMPVTPTVMQLQDHVTCALVDAIDDHLGPPALARLAQLGRDKSTDAMYQLWQKIVDYNIQDSVNLTLAVTRTEGLNPSVSFVTPLTALGHSFEQITDTTNGVTSPVNAAGNTFNRSLSVGFGLNGSQVHNIVLTYTMDLHKIYDAMYDTSKVGGDPNPRADGAKKWCDDARRSKSAAGITYGLDGDLALVETLETGLQSMDRGVYSPAVSGSGSPSRTTPSGSTALVAQAAGAAGFSSKIDFTLGWGVSGGASWSLLKFKGPGGGNTQPLNFSRSKQDSLISTFSATCHADRIIDLIDSRYFYQPVLRPMAGAHDGSKRNFEMLVYLRRHPEMGRDPKAPDPLPYPEGADGFYGAVVREFVIDIAIGKDETGLQLTYSGSGTGAIALVEIPTLADKDKPRSPNMNGTIAVSSFSTNSKSSFSYSIRGALADGITGSFVGNMHAGVTVDSAMTGTINNLDISQNALGLILQETGLRPQDQPTRTLLGYSGAVPGGYWAALPSCATAAPFFLNNQTVLQQLPRNVSDTLQQQ